ncbi:MAG: hypothetical protein KDI37_00900, partial [Xanthomonadales bacterium]|nr:hypothetical protein [Xanthomonadales bacterium]
DGSRVTETIGQLAFLFSDSHNGIAHWTIGGISRFEPITFLFFDATVPSVDMTGLWYDPNDPGWGVSVSHQGDVLYSLVYVYDLQGQALWVDGVSRGGAPLVDAQLYRGFGLCPIGCAENAPSPSAIDGGSFDVQSGVPGVLPFGTQLLNGNQLEWLKADRPLLPLSDTVP